MRVYSDIIWLTRRRASISLLRCNQYEAARLLGQVYIIPIGDTTYGSTALPLDPV